MVSSAFRRLSSAPATVVHGPTVALSDAQGSVRGVLARLPEYRASSEDSRTLRPSNTIQMSVGPNVSIGQSTAQIVRSRPDASATETLGRRYIFGTMDRAAISLATRLDWTFTPGLSLQLYARPYIASADYSELKELRAPRSYDFHTYGRDRGTIELGGTCGGASESNTYVIDPDAGGPAACFLVPNPDFVARRLQGNAVVRWEYRPGSTIFFVWQQDRSGREITGRLDPSRDFSEMFGGEGRDVFLIKASYWIGG